jgi:alkylated DNA repair dioxygenase AlkB
MSKRLIETEISYLDIHESLFTNPTQKQDLVLIDRPPIVVFGKEVRQNRRVGFFSDESEGYRYSGKLMKSQPLPDWMRDMMSEVNRLLNAGFNGVLVNHYVDGSDYIGAHSDDERGLGVGGIVAGLSFGAERKFRIRNKDSKKIVMDIPTKEGSLIVMGGGFQKEFTHEIPVQKRVSGERWSFTFRKHDM